MTEKTISVQDLAKLEMRGSVVDLVDVRTPLEFREVHGMGMLIARMPWNQVKTDEACGTLN